MFFILFFNFFVSYISIILAFVSFKNAFRHCFMKIILNLTR